MSNASKEVRLELQKRFGVEELFSKAQNLLSPRVIAFINNRVGRGEFLGGDLANKGYSDNPLPAFFFGSVQYNPSSESITVDPDSVGRAVFSSEQIFWRTSKQGNSTAYVEGGYKAFRKAIGRNTNVVDLTLSGRMLQGLDVQVSRRASEIVMLVGIFNEARSYAGYVNDKREFLGVTDVEQQRLADLL